MISIVVPIFNTAIYLKKCLDSLVSQSYKDIEILLVDDGSTDNSGGICLEYKKKFKNIRYLFKSNGGLSSARNYGVKHANGDLITFVDSDDWVENDFCERLFDYFVKFKADVIVSDLLLVDKHQVITRQNDNFPVNEIFYSTEKILEMMFSGFKIGSACGVLFKREIFEKIIFKENILDEDFEFSFRLYCNFTNLLLVPYRGYYYEFREGSITKSNFSDSKQAFVDNPYNAYLFLRTNSKNKKLIRLAKNFYVLRLHKTIRLICWSGWKKHKKHFRKDKKLLFLTSFDVFKISSMPLSSKLLLFAESFFPRFVAALLLKRIKNKCDKTA